MLQGGAEGLIQERQGVRAVTPAGATGVTDRWQRPGGLYWEGSGEDQGDADADAQIGGAEKGKSGGASVGVVFEGHGVAPVLVWRVHF